ncbi:hypothetical protein GCM10028822_00110 [Hymenobacter terrigena]
MQTAAVLSELKKHHHTLLPKPELLLAVFKLYTDFGGIEGLPESFNEQQLREAFIWAEAQLKTTDNGSNRVFYERYNTETYTLFDFILNRNIQEGTYRLSSYALQLCRLLGDTLFHEVKATELITHLRLMEEQLADVAHFLEWAELQLDPMFQKINGQLEQAEANIRQEVRQLQGQAAQSTEDYEHHLQETQTKLLALKAQTQQLLDAFAHSATIENQLRRLQNEAPANEQLQEQITKALRLLLEARRNLRSQSGLLERAHGRVMSLFKNLDAARFDRLSGLFLQRLLSPPDFQGPTPGPRLPDDVPLKDLHSWPLSFRYLTKTSRIFPPTRVPVPVPEPDPEAELEFRQQMQQEINLLQGVERWLHLLVEQMQTVGSVDFSTFAEAIILAEADEEQAYAIIALLMAQLVSEVAPQEGWELRVAPQEPPTSLASSSIALWPFTIQLA